ncbi:MAG: acyl carrier protein [Clostridia bacterium]|nr:acyl carrier protein [Clostridia bacterium]
MFFDKIREIIIQQLRLDENTDITMETSLINDLDADSMAAVEVIVAIEDEFDVEIPYENNEDLKTVGDIIKYLEERI